jgi:hypothetical protein
MLDLIPTSHWNLPSLSKNIWMGWQNLEAHMSIGWQPKNQDKIQHQRWQLSKYGAQLKGCFGLQMVCALIRMLVGMHYCTTGRKSDTQCLTSASDHVCCIKD